MRNLHLKAAVLRATPIILLAISGLLPLAARAESPTLAGWVEKVQLFDNEAMVKAKLDTGAKTSSIHATDIETFKRKGRSWTRFTLSYETVDDQRISHRMEQRVKRFIRVKEHDKENDRRPVVELDICIAGRWHRSQFSLADRSKFVYPVLLGRRFLAGVVVIDPQRTFELQQRCPPRDGDHKHDDEDAGN